MMHITISSNTGEHIGTIINIKDIELDNVRQRVKMALEEHYDSAIGNQGFLDLENLKYVIKQEISFTLDDIEESFYVERTWLF